ncbi:MAG: hypothetical protein LBT56_00140, partial [Prevotellaceae bacterium]|nr:hypothetical protein [Prevotellaceae bacterium]
KKQQKAIHKLKTTKERLKYVIDNAGKPMACAMLDFDTFNDFYYPRLGSFVIRGHSGSSCDCITAKEAVECAKELIISLQKTYNEL